MNDLFLCVFVIGIVIIGALVVWALLSSSSDMHTWTEEDWIENYEGDADDPMWQ
jgi:hypothetical protein